MPPKTTLAGLLQDQAQADGARLHREAAQQGKGRRYRCYGYPRAPGCYASRGRARPAGATPLTYGGHAVATRVHLHNRLHNFDEQQHHHINQHQHYHRGTLILDRTQNSAAQQHKAATNERACAPYAPCALCPDSVLLLWERVRVAGAWGRRLALSLSECPPKGLRLHAVQNIESTRSPGEPGVAEGVPANCAGLTQEM